MYLIERTSRSEISIPKFEVVNSEPLAHGFERLRYAALEESGGDVILPYTKASFETSYLHASDVKPCALYVLYSRLAFQREFKEILASSGIDLFNLQDIVYFWDGCQIRALIPPIIEVYNEPEFDGIQVFSLQDGIHRTILAGAAGLPQNYIVISDSLQDQRYLPHGIPNKWNEVNILYETPPVKNKRRYRRKPYSYMRPFSALNNPKMHAIWADYGRVPK